MSIVLPIVEPKAASKNTLGYYEEKLAQYKKEMQDNKNAINKTQSEINSSQNQIERLKNETLALTNEVKKLNEEIDKYQGDIKDKLAESKQIIEYMQLSNDRNVCLHYVFKADSVTELINRSYVVKELVDYNTKVVKELEQMISDNEKRQKEIDKRKIKITETESQLEDNIVSLGEKKETLSAGGVNIEKQIKIYDELVKMYKNKGCKTNDVIGVDCAVTGGSSVFRRPTTTGYITQEAYYKTSYSHRAVDIGSKNGRREKIYPIADGTITSKYYDNYGALCLAIEHYNLKDRKYYTSLYVHMSSYAPGLYVGKKVTSDQYIGYMGDTGYAFGVHLHMEVFPCRLYNPSDSNCYRWSVYDAYAKRLLRSGYNPRNLISFPKGTYNSWSSR
jgi:murein DD-endopeptidase MepM/ murein hydrolase activator NlpD